MNEEGIFEFRDPGRLIDGNLELVLVEKSPGNPSICYVPTYRFEMRLVGQKTRFGSIELRIGNTEHIVKYGGHIGYSVVPGHRGHRYAARSCRLLFDLARAHGINPIWITCNPDNIASRRTCEIAGGELVEIVPLPEDTDMYQGGERFKCRYRIRL